MLGQSFEVLDGCGHEELVAGAGEAPQSEPYHRENVLGLAEQPFDPLALDTGDPIGLGLHQALGIVAGVLMEVSLEPPCRAGGAAGLERAACTVTLLGDVFDGVSDVNAPGGLQLLAAGTDREIALPVVGEIGAGEPAVCCDLALIPERDVRLDMAIDQPAEHLARAIGDIASDMLGLEGEALGHPLDHRLGGIHFLGEARRRRLDVEDDGSFHVDQVSASTSKETDVRSYEGVQADIIDHLLSVLPIFDLRVFQHPTGRDMSRPHQ